MTRKFRSAAVLAAYLMTTQQMMAVDLPDFDWALDRSVRTAGQTPPTAQQGGKTPLLSITSWDYNRNQPRMVRALSPHPMPPANAMQDASQAALWYLRLHESSLGLDEQARESAVVQHVHETNASAVVVQLRQRIHGADVLDEELKVLMTDEYELVGFSGTLFHSPEEDQAFRSQSWHMPPTQAIATAFLDLYGVGLPLSALEATGEHAADWTWYDLTLAPAAMASGLDLIEPARARPCWYRQDGRLVPAWELEILSGYIDQVEADTYRYVFAADTGELLNRTNLTMDAQFEYRVWSEPSATGEHRPLNGPLQDYHPHPTGLADGWQPGFVSSTLISQDGFNVYGDEFIDPDQSVTTGNTVDAYADIADPDGYGTGDVRATVTAPGIFDHTFDPLLAPAANPTQIQGAVTQLFYLNNWLHHWWYDSGFNEAAGNAQQDNFGRGGLDSDRLLAEGQDKSGKNNANMSVRSDGESPRMQMYLWTGFSDAKVSVQPKGINPTAVGTAAFGPNNFDLTADLVLMNDGVSPPTDGCSVPAAGSLTNKIVLIDRGSCTFEQKAINAQQAGALGVVIANNQGTSTTVLGMADVADISGQIPALSVPLQDGTTIKTALTEGAQTVRLYRLAAPEVDGTIDNTVSAHEWGHYLHKRLTVCSTTQCNSQSEGWADFVALHLVLDPSDNVSGTFAVAAYAGRAGKNAAYFGIRRYPYSIDMTKNPLTFQHISDGVVLPTGPSINSNTSPNSEVHNAGEIWASMVWEAYIGLVKRSQTQHYSFLDAQRRMGDYIVAGMLFAPDQPTFTEQRDALLWAASANDPEDANIMAAGFARRGAGTCAISPARDSKDLKGVVESYVLSPSLGFGAVSLTDDSSSCDQDGVLDAGEQGTLSVALRNTGGVRLEDGTLSLVSSESALVINHGDPVLVPAIEPFSEVVLKIPVSLNVDKLDISETEFTLTFGAVSACVPSLSTKLYAPMNLDDLPAVSATDTAESQNIAWTEEIATGSSVWTRPRTGTLNHVYNGLDLARLGDIRFVSPALPVSKTTPFILTFEHRYKWETSTDTTTGVTTYWDGSVLEISTDNGQNWEDISIYKDPGYNGTIGNTAGNPLMDRRAFVGTSTGYPSMNAVYLNLGTRFSGKTLKVRFRIGTDQGSGDVGWDLDNISFSGITTTPFGAITDDRSEPGTFYSDVDQDGFGSGSEIRSCTILAGSQNQSLPCEDLNDGCEGTAIYVLNASDCNDTHSDISPSAAEVCDLIDNNCDSVIDQDAVDRTQWFTDQDQDSYGSPEGSVLSCTAPDGTVDRAGDCDDALSTINEGAAEVCDGIDNNCDSVADEGAVDAPTWYLDTDGDGYASAVSVQACSAPEGYLSAPSDCDDSLTSISPGADEICNGIDDNCDQSIDADALDAPSWYLDQDGDGAGTTEDVVASCSAPSGYVSQTGDCNDADLTISPTAEETCNLVDDNCSGTVDEEALDVTPWYLDGDGDGYGIPQDTVSACSAPAGYAGNSADCNDQDLQVSPSAAETCDEVDNNCNGTADENSVDATTWYVDADQDQYGAAEGAVQSCVAPAGAVAVGGDCNDQDPATYPGAAEVPGDSVDHNCDGSLEEVTTPTSTPTYTPTPTQTSEVTPTAQPETTPTSIPDVTPTATPELTSTPDDGAVAGCACSTPTSQTTPWASGSGALLVLALAVVNRRRRHV